MRPRTVPIAIVAALALLLVACGDDDTTTADTPLPEDATTTEAPPDEPPGADGPTASEPAAGELDVDNVETVAEGLDVPWAVAFVDDDTILVTEREGQVRVVEDGTLRGEPVGEVEVDASGESGLLGLALHPDFEQERFAYLYYTDSGGNQVSRFPVGDDLTFGDEEVLLDDIPSAPAHDGGRIAFGPDDHLYVATGDALAPESAADVESLAGKILRIDADGEVPADNPFDGSPVYSYGHRNPQGLAWDDDDNLYASEHGPTGEFDQCCNDELNLVEAGGFYGWPFSMGEVDGAEGEPPADTIEPVANSGEGTWAPAGIAVRSEAEGNAIYMANLGSEDLLRFQVADDDPTEVVSTDVALEGEGRLRAALFGPDDCLYVTTSNTDGRGEPADADDRLLRICPTAADDLS
ncbi:PQQ-dependent sugar dehydrogenase [soil metagenome]